VGTMIRICAAHELTPGSRRVIDLNDDDEALVLNVDGRLYGLSNICPHQGAALARGPVEGVVLYCPLHRWGFTLTTGACIDDASICVRTYRVEIHNGDVLLHLP
jgi:3-phenylpropionate/trans-cinnamate dioxygenase ferredoxin component